MSLDPKVATTMEPYQYVGNDPLNGTDPTGLKETAAQKKAAEEKAARAAAAANRAAEAEAAAQAAGAQAAAAQAAAQAGPSVESSSESEAQSVQDIADAAGLLQDSADVASLGSLAIFGATAPVSFATSVGAGAVSTAATCYAAHLSESVTSAASCYEGLAAYSLSFGQVSVAGFEEAGAAVPKAIDAIGHVVGDITSWFS